MKLHLPILVLCVSLLSSCYTYKTNSLYHNFTNEFDAIGQVQTDRIQVYHQVVGNDLSVKMVNISDTNYLFNWSKSTVSINNQLITTGTGIRTALIPPGKIFEVRIPFVQELQNQGISLLDTAKPINVKTYLTWSDISEQNFYTNTYTMQRIGTSTSRSTEDGVNAIHTAETVEELSGGGTFFTIVLGTIMKAPVLMADEEEVE